MEGRKWTLRGGLCEAKSFPVSSQIREETWVQSLLGRSQYGCPHLSGEVMVHPRLLFFSIMAVLCIKRELGHRIWVLCQQQGHQKRAHRNKGWIPGEPAGIKSSGLTYKVNFENEDLDTWRKECFQSPFANVPECPMLTDLGERLQVENHYRKLEWR